MHMPRIDLLLGTKSLTFSCSSNALDDALEHSTVCSAQKVSSDDSHPRNLGVMPHRRPPSKSTICLQHGASTLEHLSAMKQDATACSSWRGISWQPSIHKASSLDIPLITGTQFTECMLFRRQLTSF